MACKFSLVKIWGVYNLIGSGEDHGYGALLNTTPETVLLSPTLRSPLRY